MDDLPISQALRLIRARLGLTQTAATRGSGAPDFRTLSHWETGRKVPSLKLLYHYLVSLDLNFRDLQDALDLARGEKPRRRAEQTSELGWYANEHEPRLLELQVGRLPPQATQA